ncbi:MAG TPA: type II secretion system secretin GspD [Candidatus Saccharimonadia bacterium]|nr:type II secretion system secretin GspD [Candidatus Saccharimonadia bacterium]
MHKAPLMLAFAALTLLAGCRTAPERRERELVLDSWPAREPAVSVAEERPPPPEPTVAESDAAITAARASRAEVEMGSGVFFNRNVAGRSLTTPSVAGEVTFNWENVPVQEVVKAILGDLMQENYVIAPGVQGSVTFATSRPISASQALGVLEMVLSWNGAAIVHKDGRYTVLPLAQALPGNLTPRIGPPSLARGYEVRVVPLKYVSPTEMQKILTPYVRQGAIISADNTRGMIVLAGNASELANYIETIEVFDVNWLKGMSVGIFPLERVDAKEIVPELDKIFGEGAGTPLAGMFRFLPIERMNAVLVITQQPEYLAEAEKWLARLDRGGSDAGSQLYVYYVKNVKATDLAEKLTEVFTGSKSTTRTTTATVGGVVPGVESVEISSLNAPAREAQVQSEVKTETTSDVAPVAPVSAPGAVGGTGIAIVESENIKITAIEESNALMIRATSSEYHSIERAIQRLDIVPLQVVIEAKILQVNLTDNLRFGVKWAFENSRLGEDTFGFRTRVRGFGTANEGRNSWVSYAGAIADTGALTWTFVNTAAEAMLSALQTDGRTEILSAPSLVVLNNKEASINVGQQLPVVSSFIGGGGFDPNNPGTGNPGLNQSYVQFRDVGVILSVTPRVNPGGLVFLEIKQEKSSPGSGPVVGGNISVNKQTIETEIAVQSGETVLLGGLIDDSAQKNKDGVPGLSKIPIIGRLFGTSSVNKARTELLVLITPTVIENSQQARDVTHAYRENFKGLRPLLQREVDRAPSVRRYDPPRPDPDFDD